MPASVVAIASEIALTALFKWRHKSHHAEAVVWLGYSLGLAQRQANGLPKRILIQKNVR